MGGIGWCEDDRESLVPAGKHGTSGRSVNKRAGDASGGSSWVFVNGAGLVMGAGCAQVMVGVVLTIGGGGVGVVPLLPQAPRKTTRPSQERERLTRTSNCNTVLPHEPLAQRGFQANRRTNAGSRLMLSKARILGRWRGL